MEDIERFWNAVRVHRVEALPESKGPESVIDAAIDRLKSELPKILEGYFSTNLNDPSEQRLVFTNAIADSFKILLHALVEEQQKQDISVVIQMYLEGSGMSPVEIKEFLRALPRTLINKILLRMDRNKQQCGLQMMLSLEALFRDKELHQDYEVTKEGTNRIVVIFYPKDNTGPLSFRLRDMFTGG
jgi:hypothetical protein